MGVSYTLPCVHEVRTVAEARTLTIRGEIDPVVVIALQRRIRDALGSGHRRIVIDLSAVTFLGAQTSPMLGGALRRLASRTAGIALVGSPPPVRRVLELCAIDGIAFYPDVEAAIAALTARAVARGEVFA